MSTLRLYAIFRAIQAYFPSLRRAKFELYILMTRHFGLKIEDEFRLLSHFGRVNLAIDVGGNWGQSVEALRRTCAPNQIVCIEPNPYLAKTLKDRYRSQGEITVLETALADKPGELPLFVPRYHGFIYDGLASLDRASAEEWLNEARVAGFDRRKLCIEEHKVQIATLDSLGLSPDVVKIDVQGFELQVVKGGRETFCRSQPVTIVETPNELVIALLAEYGLKPYRFHKRRLIEGATGALNTVFLGHRDQERFASLIAARPQPVRSDQPARLPEGIAARTT